MGDMSQVAFSTRT